MTGDKKVSTQERMYKVYYRIERSAEEWEKIRYDQKRAARRAKSKATIIGMFSDAKKNLWDLRTISGLDERFGNIESYREYLCEILASRGVLSDDDYSNILSEMNQYSDIDDFLSEEFDQAAEFAAFGLLLYDRIHVGALEKIGYQEFFDLTTKLADCMACLKLTDAVSERARNAAKSKLAKDPKQIEKAGVRECWVEWQKTPLDRDGKPKYKGKEAFARDMLTKYESLESTQVVTRWCRTWERET